MPRSRVIPPKLHKALLERAGTTGDGGPALSAWLLSAHGIEASPRAVQRYLKEVGDERAPIARAVAREQLSKTVTSDLDAIDQLLRDAQQYQIAAGRLADLVKEAERVAKADLGKAVDEKTGRLKPLSEMPDDIRLAIAGIEVEELFEGQGEARTKIGDLVKVKLWDKTRGIELAAKIRSGHMAMQAMAMEAKLRALRLEMAGALPKTGEASEVRKRLIAKVDAFTSGKAHAGSPLSAGGSAGGGTPEVH